MVRSVLRRHPVASFFVLTYALSWAVWAPLVVERARPGPRTLAFVVLGAFGPAASAALVTWLTGGSVRAWAGQVLRWRVAPRWYAVAFLLPPGYVVAASLLDVGLLGTPLDLSNYGVIWMYLPTFAFVLLAGGGNEEPGWRGFALPMLQRRYSGLVASLVVGVGWLVWHLPLFAVPGSSQYGLSLPLYAVAVLALSVVFTWLYNNTGGSVLLAMLLHASVNSSMALYLAGPARVTSTTAYGLITALAVALAVALVLVYGPELARDGVPAGEAGRERRGGRADPLATD